jgi:hypothetical protein
LHTYYRRFERFPHRQAQDLVFIGLRRAFLPCTIYQFPTTLLLFLLLLLTYQHDMKFTCSNLPVVLLPRIVAHSRFGIIVPPRLLHLVSNMASRVRPPAAQVVFWRPCGFGVFVGGCGFMLYVFVKLHDGIIVGIITSMWFMWKVDILQRWVKFDAHSMNTRWIVWVHFSLSCYNIRGRFHGMCVVRLPHSSPFRESLSCVVHGSLIPSLPRIRPHFPKGL